MAHIRMLINGQEREFFGDLLSGVKDIHGKEIKEGHKLRIRRYENLGKDFSKEEREELGAEYIKGELEGEYIADVVWEDMSLIALQRGDIKELHGLICDPIVLLGDVNCFPYEEAEII